MRSVLELKSVHFLKGWKLECGSERARVVKGLRLWIGCVLCVMAAGQLVRAEDSTPAAGSAPEVASGVAETAAGEEAAVGEEATADEAELLPVWDAEKISILANQGTEPVRFWLEQKRNGERREMRLQPGETVSIPNPQQVAAVFERGKDLIRLRLLQDEIYLFVKSEGMQELFGIGPDYGTIPPQSRIQGRANSEFESEDETENESKNSGNGTADGSGAADSIRPGGVPAEHLPFLTIPVVVFTDSNIPLAEKYWQNRVRQRVAAASKILEQTCSVRLAIQSFQSWESDPKCANLAEVLKDFESKVPETPGVLAVGFTSHRNAAGQVTELGVARQPFCGRILLREEAPQITEVERLETLLHEIGHFLGAVHTSDENSVMRTILHERRSRNVNFEIGFDPLNALAMNLWARQFRRGDRKRLRTIHSDVCEELITVYQLVQQIAKDQQAAGVKVLENPNVEMFLKMLNQIRELQQAVRGERAPAAEKPAETGAEMAADSEKETVEEAPAAANSAEPAAEAVRVSASSGNSEEAGAKTAEIPAGDAASEVEAVPTSDVQTLRQILREMTAASWETEKVDEMELPVRTARYVLVKTLLALATNEPLKDFQSDGKAAGDVLGEKIVRYAAWAAMEVGGTGTADSAEGKAALGAFLLACEICLEPTGAIQKIPIYGRRFRAIETKEIREIRKKLIGEVSVFGRQDHSQHFWVSAGLAVQVLPELVENIGVEKELNDDRKGGSGFDVTDLNADVAGAWFGRRVMRGEISLQKVGRSFDYAHVVPAQIRIPKRLKHPKDVEEIQELVQELRKSVHQLQKQF